MDSNALVSVSAPASAPMPGWRGEHEEVASCGRAIFGGFGMTFLLKKRCRPEIAKGGSLGERVQRIGAKRSRGRSERACTGTLPDPDPGAEAEAEAEAVGVRLHQPVAPRERERERGWARMRIRLRLRLRRDKRRRRRRSCSPQALGHELLRMRAAHPEERVGQRSTSTTPSGARTAASVPHAPTSSGCPAAPSGCAPGHRAPRSPRLGRPRSVARGAAAAPTGCARAGRRPRR